VLELLVRAVFGGVRFAGFSLFKTIQNHVHKRPQPGSILSHYTPQYTPP